MGNAVAGQQSLDHIPVENRMFKLFTEVLFVVNHGTRNQPSYILRQRDPPICLATDDPTAGDQFSSVTVTTIIIVDTPKYRFLRVYADLTASDRTVYKKVDVTVLYDFTEWAEHYRIHDKNTSITHLPLSKVKIALRYEPQMFITQTLIGR